MSAELNIYGAKGQIESALKTIFEAASLTCSTPATAAAFQKTRPRVEIVMDPGQEKQSYHVFSDGSKRNASWGGQITLLIIGTPDTRADAIGTHREYEAAVASCMATITATLNSRNSSNEAVYLPYHKIQRITGIAFVPTFKFEEGYIASRPTFSCDFGVDHAAWTELSLTATN